MKFIYSTKTKKEADLLAKLIENSMHQQLFLFLREHSDKRVTLRDIERFFYPEVFPSNNLDQLIQNGFIQRKNRAYRLSLPIISQADCLNKKKQVEDSIKKSLLSFEQIKTLIQTLRKKKGNENLPISLILSFFLIDTIPFEKNSDYLFITDEKIKLDLPDFTFVQEVKTSVFHFYNFGSSCSWANYVSWHEGAQSNSHDIYQIVLDKVGDVRLSYLLEMSGKKLMQVDKSERFMERKYNLFTDVLKDLGYLREENQVYQIQAPVYLQSQINTLQADSDFQRAKSLFTQLWEDISSMEDSSQTNIYVLMQQAFFLQYCKENWCQDGEVNKWVIVSDI